MKGKGVLSFDSVDDEILKCDHSKLEADSRRQNSLQDCTPNLVMLG